MPKCFIAMPITTPRQYAEQLDDQDHFAHVLEGLFKPALAKAGYIAVPPVSSGSELIMAAIIKNLEECDLVLCDISTLNPNVFFELGIRTALNKPVVIVRDSLTPAIPFDTGSVNTHTYDVGLRSWLLTSEIDQLVDHIATTAAKSEGQNPLWRFFGITQIAEPALVENPTEAKLDLIIAELAELKRAEVSGQTTFPAAGYYSTAIPTGNWIPNNALSTFTVQPSTGGSYWIDPVVYNPDVIPVNSAPQEVQDFAIEARNIALHEGANLQIDGYNTRTSKLLLNCGRWPLSQQTAAAISRAGMKRKVAFELRNEA